MDWVHLHLALNHVPVLGTVFVGLLLGAALFRKSDELKRVSLVGFVALAPAVVELDDSSHSRHSQKRNDAFKNETFAACAIPLVRFPVKTSYNPEEIAAQINTAFGR